MVIFLRVPINAGVYDYVLGVQFGDQPCNQPIGGMTFNKRDQTMLGRVP
jgi:hypothetical protein